MATTFRKPSYLKLKREEINLLREQGIRGLKAQGSKTKALADEINLLNVHGATNSQAIEAKIKLLENEISLLREQDVNGLTFERAKTKALGEKLKNSFKYFEDRTIALEAKLGLLRDQGISDLIGAQVSNFRALENEISLLGSRE